MTSMFIAAALAAAAPSGAPAQTAPAPAPAPAPAKKCCCEGMKEKMDCCKDEAGSDAHKGHDMSKHQQHQQHQH